MYSVRYLIVIDIFDSDSIKYNYDDLTSFFERLICTPGNSAMLFKLSTVLFSWFLLGTPPPPSPIVVLLGSLLSLFPLLSISLEPCLGLLAD